MDIPGLQDERGFYCMNWVASDMLVSGVGHLQRGIRAGMFACIRWAAYWSISICGLVVCNRCIVVGLGDSFDIFGALAIFWLGIPSLVHAGLGQWGLAWYLLVGSFSVA